MQVPSTVDRLVVVIGLFLVSVFAVLQCSASADKRSELQRFEPAEINISTTDFNARELVSRSEYFTIQNKQPDTVRGSPRDVPGKAGRR